MANTPESLLQVTTTLPSQEQALELGRALVEAGLVACAQMSGPITSLYRWQGKLCEDQEFRLTLKTRLGLYKALEQKILSLHPYQVPQILATEMTDWNQDYGLWVLENTALSEKP